MVRIPVHHHTFGVYAWISTLWQDSKPEIPVIHNNWRNWSTFPSKDPSNGESLSRGKTIRPGNDLDWFESGVKVLACSCNPNPGRPTVARKSSPSIGTIKQWQWNARIELWSCVYNNCPEKEISSQRSCWQSPTKKSSSCRNAEIPNPEQDLQQANVPKAVRRRAKSSNLDNHCCSSLSQDP